jgi:hypothetical protein
MRFALILGFFSLFGLSLGSMLFSGSSYVKYRELIPKRSAVGLLSWIHAQKQIVHDPRDPNVSDECRKYLKRYKVGLAVAIFAMTLFMLLAVGVRQFGLQSALLDGSL